MLDFRINTFLAVCDKMNFTKASEELNITQPAVSQHIKYLEDYYGMKFFAYEGKKMYLTASGHRFLQLCRTLKNDVNDIEMRMKSEDPATIPVNFAVTMTIGEYVIAKPLAMYMKANPQADIYMNMGNTRGILNKLDEGAINFAIVEGYFPLEKYDSIVFSKEDFICVCSSKHKFKKKPVFLSDLFNEKLIVREPGSGTRDILSKNLEARNLCVDNFARISEIGNISTIVQMLKEDSGISFLYRKAVQKEIENGDLKEIKLKDFILSHDFSFIWQKGSVFSEDYKKICHDLQS